MFRMRASALWVFHSKSEAQRSEAFYIYVARIKVFLEIHIDFQKCTEHHIFIPFQNNPSVSFLLQTSEHLPWEQDYFRHFIYVLTHIHKYELFHMTLATTGSFLRTTISEADITCTLREFLFYESQPRFSLRSTWATWSPHPQKPGLFCTPHPPKRRKPLCSQILFLSLHVWHRLTLRVCEELMTTPQTSIISQRNPFQSPGKILCWSVLQQSLLVPLWKWLVAVVAPVIRGTTFVSCFPDRSVINLHCHCLLFLPQQPFTKITF